LKFTQKQVKSVAVAARTFILTIKFLIAGVLGAKQANYDGYARP